MTVETASLFVFAVMILGLILGQALVLGRVSGMGYVLGNRAAPPAEAAPVLGRLTRALGNSLEAAAIFVPLVVVVAQVGSSAATQWGAMGFVAARLGYALAYAAGVTGLRTLLWNAGVLCLVVMGYGVLTA